MMMDENGRTMRMLRSLALVAVIGWMLLAVGCNKTTDVSHDPAFGSFSAVIGTWKSKVPVCLWRFRGELYLMLPETGYEGEQLNTLPAGTELRVEHLVFRETLETDFLDVTGSLTSGKYAGKTLKLAPQFFPARMVDHAELWHGRSDVREMKWSVNPDKLERVSAGPPATAPKAP